MTKRRRVFPGGQLASADGRMAGRLRLRLTASEADQARRLIQSGLTQREVAERLGIPLRRLRERLRDQLRIRVGRGRVRRGIRRTPFPFLTDEEIAARCAQVRATWTEEREREAWVGGPPRNVDRSPEPR